LKKVLIISYYWPPSGGAGVQRWVKYSKYLNSAGVDVSVITVDDKVASYSSIDESLIKDVDSNIKVYRTKSFEIINWYSSLVGKKNVPTAGFSNVNNEGWIQKLATAIRSNFFIPDPRIGWNKYAYKKAIEIIQKESITTVITTSPPHSTQLIGLKLKRKLGIKWIADLRDPWTDIYYYDLLRHSSISNKINKQFERKVFKHADQILTVSKGLKNLFSQRFGSKIGKKTTIIYNGFDEDDFNGKTKSSINKNFTISYTGTISDQYDPILFLEALDTVSKKLSNISIMLQFVGTISSNIAKLSQSKHFETELVSTVPHNLINQYQVDADMLLLVIPNTTHAAGIATGKFFEYLASQNPIVCLGPKQGDVVDILKATAAGKSFDRSQKSELIEYLTVQINKSITENLPRTKKSTIQQFSRQNQANEIKELI
jgi:glycosyltransferase involved in cell wall biosynthesis